MVLAPPEGQRVALPSALERTLSRAWPLMLAFLVLGAGAGIVRLDRLGPSRQAAAVVVASRTSMAVDDFADLSEALFGTDAVLARVAQSLHLDTSPAQLLETGALAIDPIPNAIAARIIATDDEPDTAVALANAAAESYSEALTSRQLGTFQVFRSERAVPVEGQPTRFLPFLLGALGALLGGVIGYFVDLLRRPIANGNEAVRVLTPSVVVSCKVFLPRLALRRKHKEDQARVVPTLALSAIKRAIESNDHGTSHPCFVLVERRRRGDRAARFILRKIITFIRDNGEAFEHGTVVEARDPKVGAALRNSDLVVVIVSEDAPLSAVERTAEELRVQDEAAWCLLVYVRPRLRILSRRSRMEIEH
jgi:hypothetical protein